MGREQLTTETFIKKANIVHNNKYNYSLVDYTKSTEKVKIICPLHGEFLQIPSGHLVGNGCAQCGILKNTGSKVSTSDFIEKAKKVHGEKYDYSKVDYKRNSIKIIIGCPIHGDFNQTPNDHLDNCGCPKCGIIKITSTSLSNSKEKLTKALKEIHNDKFIPYWDTFTGIKNSMKFNCIKHGDFIGYPYDISKGTKCSKCSKEDLHTLNKETNSKLFIEKASKVHNNQYDYSKIDYVNSATKVEIVCKEHGSFWQTPCRHIQKDGCVKCSREKGYNFHRNSFANLSNKSTGRYLTFYILYFEYKLENFIKVGITSRDIKQRLKGFPKCYKINNTYEFSSFDGVFIYDLERYVLKHFSKHSYTPLVRFAGDTECFITDAVVDISTYAMEAYDAHYS